MDGPYLHGELSAISLQLSAKKLKADGSAKKLKADGAVRKEDQPFCEPL
jgi:hypothetical protein